MAGEDRDLVRWALSSLMVAEERITTKFSGLVGAYGSEEEATFLATQQVDEARHMQFYARFQDEVIADPATIGDHVARSRERLSSAFGQGLRRRAGAGAGAAAAQSGRSARQGRVRHDVSPRDRGHARPGAFEFISRYLEREGLLPGFVAGYTKIHHDEHRHIGYGTWYLQSAVAGDAALADEVRQTLRDLLPAVAASLAPPDHGDATDWDALGASADEIHAFALNGLNRRLSVIGVELAWIYSASTVARRRTIASRADPWPSPPLTEPFPQTRCEKAVNRCFPGPPAVPVRD